MLETILAISGKPGLYKLVSRGNRSLIVETLSAFDYKKASREELASYFAEILPNYDRDRVYPADIKKLVSWYNLLVKAGMTDFDEVLAPTEGDHISDRAEQE